MKMSNAVEKRTWDVTVALAYLAFWPLVTFSYFLAADSIRSIVFRDQTNAVLQLCINMCVVIIHMFSINCIILTIAEVYLVYTSKIIFDFRRQMLPEISAIVSSFFIIVLSFLNILVPIIPYYGELNDNLNFALLLISWLGSFCYTVFSVRKILNINVCV